MSIAREALPSNVLPGLYTLAEMMALDPATNTRKYAWCTDLFGSSGGDMCLSDGANWRPVRPMSVQTVANGNQNMSFTCMAQAPTQVIQGVLTTARTVTLSTTYAYRGARFRIKREAGGLFALLINGVGISLNSWADFEFDGSAWVQTASGGLL